MKKKLFYFVFTLALTLSFSMLSTGQNLVVNGDLESWTAGAPDGWNLIENISQESTTVHGGSYSAKHTSGEGGAKYFQQNISGIQAGQDYTISYWYYDDDAQAKTRIWSYWLSGTSTLPDGGDILRANEYSEDNGAWIDFNEVLTAPAGADGFRFEVRVYHQDNLTGGSVFYDDFSISGDIVVDPEPTNYPTDFEAIAAGGAASIDIFWSDATGAQLPSAYVILAGTSSTLPVPVDGTPIPDDTDFSDGSGALNISYGMEECSFNFLDPNTSYYFSIYSYTNGGANIDYKNDGTAPTATAITANITIINFEDFEDGTLGTWWQYSVASDQDWINSEFSGNKFAKANGYGADVASDDWLISPPLNLDDYDNEVLLFETAKNYDDAIEGIEIKISEDYSGSGDPYSADWTVLTATLSTGGYVWVPSGNIDISTYSGSAVYIAFHYMSTGTEPGEATTWEVDNISISGEEDIVILPEPTNYPSSFEAIAIGTDISLFWDDATGAELPEAYIIFAGTSASLPTPSDGTPVPNDTDLSDGSGAINVAYGMEEILFSDLMQGTTYYFSIYPYNNAGVNIDYKNDGTAPTATEMIPAAPEPSNYPTSFMADATTSEIYLTWVDASGVQLPEAYIVFANTDQASLPTPADGTPVADDTDLSDGAGALNVLFGIEEAMFADLEQGTTYYLSIYPYNNTGTNIDYKNDGSAPTTNIATLIINEPTNYPTSFEATAGTTTIDLSWIDATGEQLPEAYIIFAGISASLPVPADGTPTPDDLDLSDGSGAANIDYGVEAFTFSNLEPSTTYYFSIYPYTGSGSDIDYKNDGTAPAVNDTTEESATTVVIESENFDESWGNWIIKNVVGINEWDRNNTFGNETPCAEISGHLGNQVYEDSDDWLISPELDLSNYVNVEFTFWTATGYFGNELEVKVSEDYDGESDPNTATWTNLEATLATNDVFWTWTFSEIVDLAMYSGSSIHLAFLYTSTTEEAATWEVDDIIITGEENLSSDNQLFADELFNVYPNPTTGLIYFENLGTEFTHINIISAIGQIVKSVDSSAELTKIDLSELNKGLYIVSLNNKETGQTITRKLILR